ncbi:hypothetical protein DXG01_016237 [Tephrocybe rancida]|nr:hypothetical protein DXG01_016237 [Tephrocybe rancida]
MFVPFFRKRFPKGGGGSTAGITGTNIAVSSTSKGGGEPTKIPEGGSAGRTVGGGTRDEIYGTSAYGSGYSHTSRLGVIGRGFPFDFLPLVFIVVAGTLTGECALVATETHIYYMYADQESVSTAITGVNTNYSMLLAQNVDSTPVLVDANGAAQNSSYPTPNPAEAVQFFRSSWWR